MSLSLMSLSLSHMVTNLVVIRTVLNNYKHVTKRSM